MRKYLNLLVREIAEVYVQKNFKLLQEYHDAQGQLDGFKFLEFSLTDATNSKKIPHGLGFVPRDIVRTRLTGQGKLTFHYSEFTREHIVVSSTGAARFRGFAGTYAKEQTPETVTSTEYEEMSALQASGSGTVVTVAVRSGEKLVCDIGGLTLAPRSCARTGPAAGRAAR